MRDVSMITKQVFVYNNNNVEDKWLTDCFGVFSAHVENEEQYIQALERFMENTVYKDDPEMPDYFLKFAGFTKELTGLFKNLVSKSLTSICCRIFQTCICLACGSQAADCTLQDVLRVTCRAISHRCM